MSGGIMEFPWFHPALLASFPPGLTDAPFYDVNRIQKAYFQFGSASQMMVKNT